MTNDRLALEYGTKVSVVKGAVYRVLNPDALTSRGSAKRAQKGALMS